MYMTLMNQVRRKMEMGIAQPSIARWGLEKQENFGLTDLEIAYALSAPFTAGVGTVSLPARQCRYLANFDPGQLDAGRY